MQEKKKEESNMDVKKKKECVERELLAAQNRHQELKNLPREERKVGHATELKGICQQMVNLKKKLGAPMKAPKSAAEWKIQVKSHCYKRSVLQQTKTDQTHQNFLPSP